MRHRRMESMKRLRDSGEANDNMKGLDQYRIFAKRVEEIGRKYKKSMFIIRQKHYL